MQCAPTIVLVLILHCDLAILVDDDFPYLSRLGHGEPASVTHALACCPLDPRQVIAVGTHHCLDMYLFYMRTLASGVRQFGPALVCHDGDVNYDGG